MLQSTLACKASKVISEHQKVALFLQLGAQADTSPALLATFTETEFNDLISFWKIATSVDASGVVTEERRPNAIETGAARFFGRICRLRLGVQSAGHATPAGSVPPSGSTVASRKLKLSQIISQVDETEIEPLSESDVLGHVCTICDVVWQRPKTT